MLAWQPTLEFLELLLNSEWILSKMFPMQLSWERERAEEEGLYGIEQELGYSACKAVESKYFNFMNHMDFVASNQFLLCS